MRSVLILASTAILFCGCHANTQQAVHYVTCADFAAHRELVPQAAGERFELPSGCANGYITLTSNQFDAYISNPDADRMKSHHPEAFLPSGNANGITYYPGTCGGPDFGNGTSACRSDGQCVCMRPGETWDGKGPVRIFHPSGKEWDGQKNHQSQLSFPNSQDVPINCFDGGHWFRARADGLCHEEDAGGSSSGWHVIGDVIEQHSATDSSPNIVAGDGSHVEINGTVK